MLVLYRWKGWGGILQLITQQLMSKARMRFKRPLCFVGLSTEKVSRTSSLPKWCTLRSGRWRLSWRWYRGDWVTSTCGILRCSSIAPESIASTSKHPMPSTVSSKKRCVIVSFFLSRLFGTRLGLLQLPGSISRALKDCRPFSSLIPLWLIGFMWFISPSWLGHFRSETMTCSCRDSTARSSPGSKRSNYDPTVHHNEQIPFKCY